MLFAYRFRLQTGTRQNIGPPLFSLPRPRSTRQQVIP